MANYQVWFTIITGSGGVWNGSPGANPALQLGGIAITAVEPDLIYPTVQGTGDVQIQCNFGQNLFKGTVPAGFNPGWPNAANTGFTKLDPARAFGSGVNLTGDYQADFIASPGMVQAEDGYATGAYYWEFDYSHEDIFNNWPGGGVGRDYLAGGSFGEWIAQGGKFALGDANGGTLIRGTGWPNFQSSLYLFGNEIVPGFGTFGPSVAFQTVGVAVFLTGDDPPPPFTGKLLYDKPLMQQPMPCVPCCNPCLCCAAG